MQAGGGTVADAKPAYWRMVQGRPDPTKAMAKLNAQIPLGRLGQPHEVANTVVWLLSQASSFTTGSEVLVDGGLIAG